MEKKHILFWCIYYYFYLTKIFLLCLDAPSVHVPGQGIVVGKYLKMFRTQNVKVYLGIPYAKAQRFSPPEISDIKWSGVLNATTFAPFCWQKMRKPADIYTGKIWEALEFNTSQYAFDEDCLFLNIFIPDGSPGRYGYAVVVYIHGGDFSSGFPIDINPFQLVFKQKIIVVTMSYRLNIFGFLTTGDGAAQGNFGLMDQAAALFWIKKNINHFGGDDQKITIMGHSAGAVSVGLHMTSGEWSMNSFNKAIMMSGNPLSVNSVKTRLHYEENLEILSKTFGCSIKPSTKLLQCLRRLNPRTLTDQLPAVEWGPIIDLGLSNASLPFIPEHPDQLFKKGLLFKVPTLIGITDMEDILIFEDDNTKINGKINNYENYIRNLAYEDFNLQNPNIEDCNNLDFVENTLSYMYSEINGSGNILIDLHNDKTYKAPMHLLAEYLKNDVVVYAYISKTAPKSEFLKLPAGVGVPKHFDQVYVWGAPYMESSNIIKTWHSSDKRLSDIIMTLFANFIKTSNPTSSNIYIKWNAYAQSNAVLQIDEDFKIENNNDNYKIKFWNQYYPKVLTFAAECCNNTSGTQPQHNVFTIITAHTYFYCMLLIFFII